MTVPRTYKSSAMAARRAGMRVTRNRPPVNYDVRETLHPFGVAEVLRRPVPPPFHKFSLASRAGYGGPWLSDIPPPERAFDLLHTLKQSPAMLMVDYLDLEHVAGAQQQILHPEAHKLMLLHTLEENSTDQSKAIEGHLERVGRHVNLLVLDTLNGSPPSSDVMETIKDLTSRQRIGSFAVRSRTFTTSQIDDLVTNATTTGVRDHLAGVRVEVSPMYTSSFDAIDAAHSHNLCVFGDSPLEHWPDRNQRQTAYCIRSSSFPQEFTVADATSALQGSLNGVLYLELQYKDRFASVIESGELPELPGSWAETIVENFSTLQNMAVWSHVVNTMVLEQLRSFCWDVSESKYALKDDTCVAWGQHYTKETYKMFNTLDTLSRYHANVVAQDISSIAESHEPALSSIHSPEGRVVALLNAAGVDCVLGNGHDTFVYNSSVWEAAESIPSERARKLLTILGERIVDSQQVQSSPVASPEYRSH